MNAHLKQAFAVLRFSKRILDWTKNPDMPLLERLHFLSIFGANLEEFLALRLPRLKKHNIPVFKLSQAAFLLHQQAEECLKNTIQNLSHHSIFILKKNAIPNHEELRHFYQKEIAPFLQKKVVLNKNFKFKNNTLYSIFKEEHLIKIVAFPTEIPFFLSFETLPNKIIFLTDFILKFCPEKEMNLFFSVQNMFLDIPIPVELSNFSHYLEPKETALFLYHNKKVKQYLREINYKNALFLEYKNDFIPFKYFFKFLEYIHNSDLQYPSFPHFPSFFKPGEDVFQHIKKQDMLIMHPYHNFESISNFIQWATNDPKVSQIYLCIYRTIFHSNFIQNLIQAAQKGKKVVVFIELLARQDEENNFNLFNSLKKAGVFVYFSKNGFKLHAKVILIQHENKFLAHIGTGNYNEKTAEQYIDIGIFTANKMITQSILFLFNNYFSPKKNNHFNILYFSPLLIHAKLLKLIHQETQFARQRKKAKIIAKINALTEPEIIFALKEAAQAGVKIRLIVRGACLLQPQKNIQIISVLGRFLEHSRLIYFYHQGKEKMFLSSADWMPRNLFSRYELMCPILDKEIKQKILHFSLKNYFHSKRFVLQKNGHYIFKNEKNDAQLTLLKKGNKKWPGFI